MDHSVVGKLYIEDCIIISGISLNCAVYGDVGVFTNVGFRTIANDRSLLTDKQV